jgi:hypothetical protein
MLLTPSVQVGRLKRILYLYALPWRFGGFGGGQQPHSLPYIRIECRHQRLDAEMPRRCYPQAL